MERKTGATKGQIERALPDVLRIIWGVEDTRDWGSIMPVRARAAISSVVRPDERIVLADDLEHLLNAWDRHVECCRDGYQCEVWMEERAAADRLRAAIGTPTVDPVCPQCQERTYDSPRTGRTCVRNECGWRERE